MATFIVVALAIIMLWAVAVIVHEALTAPTMPYSWHDDIGDYIRCDDCCWTGEDDKHLFGDPGPGCKECPFCRKPEAVKND